ncbi:MAG: ABC transporter ATP-binding protein [Phycisphaerae bacterium]|nr:ABC transporter ATP-binding protein [Phycisphaerae bacterium]
MSDASAILAASDVRFAYRAGVEVLRGVHLAAAKGKFICLLGPNGSGKTTFLKLLLGVLSPASGRIELEAKPLEQYSARALAKKLAYVPQTPTSALNFPVRELVLMGRYAHTGAMGLPSETDLQVARLAMEMTESTDVADRTLEELSGGQAQCAMIARALAQQPGVCLLDEPTSHLDIRNQLKIYRMMRRLARDWGMAVVCVSHDINLAARFADELMLMKRGAVIAAGGPAEVIQKNLLRETYDVEIELIPTSDGPPIVRAH